MLVLIARDLSKKDSGKLSNIMYKISSDIFVGSVSAKVRQKIVEKIILKNSISSCLIYDYPNEQGFKVEKYNDFSLFLSMNGVELIKK